MSDVNSFGFILYGVFLASWICRFMCFAKFRKFSDIISLNTFSVLSYLLFLPECSDKNIKLLLLSHRSFRLCSAFLFLTLLFRMGNFYCYFFLFMDSFLSLLFCCWAHPLSFCILIIVFTSSNILILFFISFTCLLRLFFTCFYCVCNCSVKHFC